MIYVFICLWFGYIALNHNRIFMCLKAWHGESIWQCNSFYKAHRMLHRLTIRSLMEDEAEVGPWFRWCFRRSGHEGKWCGGPLGQHSFSLFFLFAVDPDEFLSFSIDFSPNSVPSTLPISSSGDWSLSSSLCPKSVDLSKSINKNLV